MHLKGAGGKHDQVMCDICNYEQLIIQAGLELTPNRMAVLQVVGQTDAPMSAAQILERLQEDRKINKVTVYRILDLLVDHCLLDRLSTGDRSFRYGLAPNANHRPHAHFYCTRCGQMACLENKDLPLDPQNLALNANGRIERVEVRIDGICTDCLNRKR